MLFEYLRSITVTKEKDLPLDEYIPYLITRWLTFGVTECTPALNETINSLGSIDKEQHYKLLLSLYPKSKKQPRFNYIKKKKQKTDSDEEKQNTLIAQALELSTREVIQNKSLVEYFNNNSK